MPVSPGEQAAIIADTADAYGRTGVVYTPKDSWCSEVSKRDFMFQLGKEYALTGDWFFRIDADEILYKTGYGTREKLQETPHDVADVLLWDAKWDGGSPLRALYRNVPDLHIEKAHYYVKAGDRVLNGPGQVESQEMWDVRLKHRTHQRTHERLERKAHYNTLIPLLEKVDDCP